jgi:acyl carrier protein
VNADSGTRAGPRPAPVSFEQERAWLEDRLAPGHGAVTGAVIRLRGPLENISAHDNFFDLGGNSLQAARVATHIEERTGMELRVRDVFSTPVVSDLAALLDQLTEDAAAGGGDVDLLAAEVADLERQLEEARELLAEQDGQEGGGS